jgi:hypothetical protein
MLIRGAFMVPPDADTAARAAAALTAHMRRTGSYDVGLAALVVDFNAVALGSAESSRVSPDGFEALTIAEYARSCGITTGAARRRAREGRISAHKERGRWQVVPQPNGRARRS